VGFQKKAFLFLSNFDIHFFFYFFLQKMKFKEIMEQARSRMKHTPLTLVDHGHVLPLGIFTTETDYDLNVVKHLIRKGHLAPFYEGNKS
jgi:hypothetical protein